MSPERLGRCYELAGRRVIMETPGTGLVLVHGTIQGMGYPPNPHAWVVDPIGSAWEPITETWFDPVAWVEFARPVEHVRYTEDEARRLAVFTGHWGPWPEGT